MVPGGTARGMATGAMPASRGAPGRGGREEAREGRGQGMNGTKGDGIASRRRRGWGARWLVGLAAALCVVGRHPSDSSAAFAPPAGRLRGSGGLVRSLLHHPGACGRAGRPARLLRPLGVAGLSCKASPAEGSSTSDLKAAKQALAGLDAEKGLDGDGEPNRGPLNGTFVSTLAGTAMSIPGVVGSFVKRAQASLPAPRREGTTMDSPAKTAVPGSFFKNLNWTASNLARLPMETWKERRQRQTKLKVTSLEQLEEQLENGVSVYNLDIRGSSQPWRQNEHGELLESFSWESVLEVDSRGDGRSEQLKHPVLEAIWQRQREGSKPGQRTDRYKIGLAIEGGGLRGSVTAGMASAVLGLGITDAFDMVLGSSAGSIIGSYLVARAQPNITYDFFCNHLTTSKQRLNGSSWLDMGRLVDLFAPALSNPQAGGGPPMLLDYPMKTIMQELLPVDWEQFSANDKNQPMKIIATGLFTEGPVVLGSQEGSYTDLASLCECVKASCMLPGVAGVEPPWLKGSSALNPVKLREGRDKWQEREFSRNVWKEAKDAFTKRARTQSPRLNGTAVIKTAFERINSDGSGGIDRLELRAALEDIGVNVTGPQLETMFVSADLDGNGIIDYQEFKALIYSLQSMDSSWTNERLKMPKSWGQGQGDIEPLVDALIFEPIPYRSAVEYGCTHVLVLRSYPDGKLLPKSLLGLFERLVAPKCLDPFPEVKQHLQTSGHSIVYAEDILRLNEGVARPKDTETEAMEVDDARDIGRYIAAQTAVWEGLIESTSISGSMPRQREPHLLAIAPLDADGEVSQLTLKREVLITGILQGFARAYDMLAPDDIARQRTGYQVAVETYLPIHYKFMNQLAREDPEEKMKQGTQTLNVKWAKRRKEAAEGDDRLGVGDKIPKTWVEGVHYTLSPLSRFDKNELVVAPRSDGTLRLARVVGSVPEEVILQVEESPVERNGRTDKVPALIFRVERKEDVGKLDPVKAKEEEHFIVEPPHASSPFARLGSMVRERLAGGLKIGVKKKEEKKKEVLVKPKGAKQAVYNSTRPE